MKNKPEILIYVNGGIVQKVYTSKPQLTFRLVDLDSEEAEKGTGVGDYEADETNADLEEITKDLIKSVWG